MSKHTCAELGVCQGRACPSCTQINTRHLPPGVFVFAPGEVEHYRRRALTPERVSATGRALLIMAALTALVATLGFLAGYLGGAGGLL